MVMWKHARISFHRCYVQKTRDPVGFFLDLFSHIFILSIVAALYSLSSIDRYPADSYSTLKLNVPPKFIANPHTSKSERFNEFRHLLSGPLPILSLDQYLLSCQFLRNNFFSDLRMLTKTPFQVSAKTILNPGPLYFAPDSLDVQSLVQYMNDSSSSFSNLDVKILPSEEAVLRDINSLPRHVQPFGFIHMKSLGGASFDVSIRQAHDPYFSTNQFVSSMWTGFDLFFINYWMGGFYSLQRSVESWLCSRSLECDIRQFAPSAIIPFPTPHFSVFQFFSAIGALLGMFLCLASVYPMAREAKALVDDKESGIRSHLFMMGLSSVGYHIGSSCFYVILYCWISLSFSLTLWLSLYRNTKFLVLFTVVLLFHFAVHHLIYFMTFFFHRGKVASTVAAITVFVFSLPRYFLISTQNDEFIAQKYLLSIIFPSSAFVFAVDFFGQNEFVGMGTSIAPLVSFEFNLTSVVLSLFVSTALYGSLGVILNGCFPCELVKPTCFNSGQKGNHEMKCVESEMGNEERVVKVTNISKVYAGGHKALQNISIEFHKNRIICLLGQNGAGKSTFVSILAGVTTPSSGTIVWNGLDHRYRSHSQRCRIGICSQHDILMPTLTVHEHLQFVIQMKDLDPASASLQAEVSELLDRLELMEKRNTQSRYLSGGMKRKLCLAMALVGNPQLVILDEPTSGVDVLSRRNICDVLLAFKNRKTILLTTHYMEEAEMLSDDVIMLSQGKVICQGSVTDLKALCGHNGYLLSFSRSSSSDREEVGPFLQREIMDTIADCPADLFPSSNPNEVSFHLPMWSRPYLATVFQRLRFSRRQYFDDMLLRNMTLEHAFLTMIGWTPAETNESKKNESRDDPALASKSQIFVDKPASVTVTVSMLFWHKYIYYRRDLFGTFFQLLLPALAMILSVTVLLINLEPDYRPLPLSNHVFKSTVHFSPTVLTSSNYPKMLSVPGMSMSMVPVKTSSEMTRYIQHGSFSPRDLTASFIYQDVIPVELTVNQTWLIENRDLALKIESYLDTIGVKIPLLTNNPSRSSSLQFDANYEPLGMRSVHTSEVILEAKYFNWNSFLTIMHRSPYIHSAAIFNSDITKQSLSNNNVIVNGQTWAPSVTITNYPLPEKDSTITFSQIQLSVVMVVLLLIPICCIPAILVSFVVMEKLNRSKLLQHLNAVPYIWYWFANWLFDFVVLLVPIVLFLMGLVGLRSVSTNVFTQSWQAFTALVICLFFYGFASIPFCYLLAMYCISDGSSSSAVVFVVLVNIVSGFGLTIVYFILVGQQEAATTALSAKIMQGIFSIFPAFNLGNGLVRICTTFYQNKMRGHSYDYLEWDVTLTPIIVLLCEGVFYFFCLLLVDDSPEKRHWISNHLHIKRKINEWKFQHGAFQFIDDDILQEELRVWNIVQTFPSGSVTVKSPLIELPSLEERDNDIEMTYSNENQTSQEMNDNVEYPLVIHKLWKTYHPHFCSHSEQIALRGLSIACRVGERLGLLGINGAGKTTTMKILTQEIAATAGEVYIGGLPLSDPKTMMMLGYCPQVDPLLELMNAYETLWFYGRIRGIAKDVLSNRIDSLITQTGLTPHAHRPSGTYSGGNKRKLSLAVALIGDPKVLLLDEPSTGMDPEARRQMWNVIQQVSNERTVILVSHSMEEIEALCTRVAVLVGGRLQCLGSIPYLKSKHNTGYLVSFKCKPHMLETCILSCFKFLVPEQQNSISDEVKEESNPNASFVVVEEQSSLGIVRLRVGRDLDLSTAFSGFNDVADLYGIEDLSITLGSLDSVFKTSVEAIPDSRYQQP